MTKGEESTHRMSLVKYHTGLAQHFGPASFKGQRVIYGEAVCGKVIVVRVERGPGCWVDVPQAGEGCQECDDAVTRGRPTFEP